MHSGFQYATTLTCAHLAITGLFLHFARILRMFEYKTLELRPLLIFSVLNGISIGGRDMQLDPSLAAHQAMPGSRW